MRALPLVVAGCLAASAAAAAEPPWVGVWAEKPAWCTPDGKADGRPLRITPTGIAGDGNQCRFIGVTRMGHAIWWMVTECEAGLLFRRRYLFEMDGKTLVITNLDEGWRETRYQRCP